MEEQMTKESLIQTIEALIKVYTKQLDKHPEVQEDIDYFTEMLHQLNETEKGETNE